MPNLSYQQHIINKSDNVPWSLSLVTQASQSYQHEQHGCSPLLLSYDEIFNLEYLHIHAFISPLSLSASQLPLFTRGCVVFCHCTSQADLLFAAPNRDRWTFTGVWTKKQNLHCTLSGYQHGWVLSAGILSLELICRMSKMGKYLERSHGDELGIAYKILQLRGGKASAVEVSRGKTPPSMERLKQLALYLSGETSAAVCHHCCQSIKISVSIFLWWCSNCSTTTGNRKSKH